MPATDINHSESAAGVIKDRGARPESKRIDRNHLRKIRYAFQWGLFFFIIYGGHRFYLFGHLLWRASCPSDR
jgi:hypothetical protein